MKSLSNLVYENLIIEKYGNYEGQLDFCNELADVLFDYDYKHENDPIEIDTSELDGFENIFFDKIVINFHQPICAILNNKSKFDDKRKKFDKIVLNIRDEDLSNKEEFINILNHEILHGWDNFNSILKKSKITLSDEANKSSYKKTIPLKNDNDVVRFCKELLNRIHKIEQNAYFSEFGTTLFKKNVKSFEEAKKLFEQSSSYQMYETYFKIFDKYIVSGSNKIKYVFCSTYNNVNNIDWSEDKIFKKIQFKIKQIQDKLNKRMGQLWCDYLEKNMHLEK